MSTGYTLRSGKAKRAMETKQGKARITQGKKRKKTNKTVTDRNGLDAVSTLNTGTTTAKSPLSLKGPELNIEEIRFKAAELAVYRTRAALRQVDRGYCFHVR